MSGPDDGAADVWGNNNLVWRSMSECVMCLDRPVGPDGYSPWQVGCSFPNCILVWYTMYISSKDNTTDTDMIPNKITPISSRHFPNLCTIYWFYLLAVVLFSFQWCFAKGSGLEVWPAESSITEGLWAYCHMLTQRSFYSTMCCQLLQPLCCPCVTALVRNMLFMWKAQDICCDCQTSRLKRSGARDDKPSCLLNSHMIIILNSLLN